MDRGRVATAALTSDAAGVLRRKLARLIAARLDTPTEGASFHRGAIAPLLSRSLRSGWPSTRATGVVGGLQVSKHPTRQRS
jgi:hypothetical protein